MLDTPATTRIATVSTRELARHAEHHAAEIRRQAGIGTMARLDPHRLVEQSGLIIVYPRDVPGMSEEDVEWMESVDPSVWSGMGIPLPDDRLEVILHPNQTPGRANVTVMEEVAHVYFGHRPSQLITQPGGLIRRQFDKRAEDEAYWTAAATLAPAEAVGMGVWQGRSSGDLAEDYGVSVELIEFRIKVLNLWRQYKRQAA